MTTPNDELAGTQQELLAEVLRRCMGLDANDNARHDFGDLNGGSLQRPTEVAAEMLRALSDEGLTISARSTPVPASNVSEGHRYDHDGTWRHHHADPRYWHGEPVWWTNVEEFGGEKRDHRHDTPVLASNEPLDPVEWSRQSAAAMRAAAERLNIPASNVSEGLRAKIEALPRIRLTGEQLDQLDPDPEKHFWVDWDEHEDFVSLGDLRAALAHAAPEGPRCDYGCDACRDFEALSDEEQRLADATEAGEERGRDYSHLPLREAISAAFDDIREAIKPKEAGR